MHRGVYCLGECEVEEVGKVGCGGPGCGGGVTIDQQHTPFV